MLSLTDFPLLRLLQACRLGHPSLMALFLGKQAWQTYRLDWGTRSTCSRSLAWLGSRRIWLHNIVYSNRLLLVYQLCRSNLHRTKLQYLSDLNLLRRSAHFSTHRRI
jgi:hypothetical protein